MNTLLERRQYISVNATDPATIDACAPSLEAREDDARLILDCCDGLPADASPNEAPAFTLNVDGHTIDTLTAQQVRSLCDLLNSRAVAYLLARYDAISEAA